MRSIFALLMKHVTVPAEIDMIDIITRSSGRITEIYSLRDMVLVLMALGRLNGQETEP